MKQHLTDNMLIFPFSILQGFGNTFYIRCNTKHSRSSVANPPIAVPTLKQSRLTGAIRMYKNIIWWNLLLEIKSQHQFKKIISLLKRFLFTLGAERYCLCRLDKQLVYDTLLSTSLLSPIKYLSHLILVQGRVFMSIATYRSFTRSWHRQLH